MKTHKELNIMISDLIGDAKIFDLVLRSDTTKVLDYSTDFNLALEAAKRIADKNGYTFVLTCSDSTWRASFGDYGDCFEYSGGNPAYCSCMAILKFMGKI
jgi:hypothetical protein